MARKTIFIGDLTGKPIDDKNAATVTIRYSDARRGQAVLDRTETRSMTSSAT